MNSPLPALASSHTRPPTTTMTPALSPLSQRLVRLLPFSSSTTPLQAATYLLGISLFSISFLVFLNSGVSFVVTDLIGQKTGVGDVVGTLGFVDELVALVACPVWGLVSDRLGVRWVAVCGYVIIVLSLAVFVQAETVYPGLLLARIFFALGATAAWVPSQSSGGIGSSNFVHSATMVTAILPSLTNESEAEHPSQTISKPPNNFRHSLAGSVDSQLTITPERYTQTTPDGEFIDRGFREVTRQDTGKPSLLAGYVGLFTGCGALVALICFLPLPAKFGEIAGVTSGQAVSYSFYVVAGVAAFVAVFVAFGLRGLRGEEGKGWRVLFGRRNTKVDEYDQDEGYVSEEAQVWSSLTDISSFASNSHQVLPYLQLLRDSIKLGFTDPNIAIGYLGGFVARASAVAISLMIPLFINTFFIENGFCHGSPNDPSAELKKECKTAYILSSVLTGTSQLVALICAPVFGYLSSRPSAFHWPIIIATAVGIVGYSIFPRLSSPEFKNVDGRGGSPLIFLVVSLIGISQIGSIVCSLGSLGKGVLTHDTMTIASTTPDDGSESSPLLQDNTPVPTGSRVRLKGSVAGVYSLCGGAAILLLTKLGGFLFDNVSKSAPFYMMAMYNAILLVVTLAIDVIRLIRAKSRHNAAHGHESWNQ